MLPETERASLHRGHIVGALIFLALVWGGAATATPEAYFLWAAALVCLPMFSWANSPSHVRPLLYLGVAIIALSLLQATATLTCPSIGLSCLLSLDAGKTVEFAFGAIATWVILLGASQLGDSELATLGRYFLAGIALNLLISVFQFSSSDALKLQFGTFEFAAGTFANQNHFASLVISLIPMALHLLLARGYRVGAIVVVGGVSFLALATRSLAAAYLSIGTLALSFALLADIRRTYRFVLLAAVLAAGVVVSFNPGNILELEPNSPLNRLQIWQTTLLASLGRLPFGVGFGNFAIAYEVAQPAEHVMGAYINQAHNEYLQLLLEAGIPGVVLAIAYAVLLIAGLKAQRPLAKHQVAAALGICVFLGHSLVDYPLRTTSLMWLFVVLSILAVRPQWSVVSAPSRRPLHLRGLVRLLGAHHLERPIRKKMSRSSEGSRRQR